MERKHICLLDLNYTLVSNQAETRSLRPFSKRLEAEEYRADLIKAIRDDYVIIITARPDHQKDESLVNVRKKTGWQPQEAYFNDIDAEPPEFKESALQRFVFPKHGEDGSQYYAVESNPKTCEMYAKYGIKAMPYDHIEDLWFDEKEMNRFKEVLGNVNGSYDDFVVSVMHLTRKNKNNRNLIESFIENNPDCTSSDVIKLMIEHDI